MIFVMQIVTFFACFDHQNLKINFIDIFPPSIVLIPDLIRPMRVLYMNKSLVISPATLRHMSSVLYPLSDSGFLWYYNMVHQTSECATRFYFYFTWWKCTGSLLKIIIYCDAIQDRLHHMFTVSLQQLVNADIKSKQKFKVEQQQKGH